MERTKRRTELVELGREKGFNPTFVDGLQAVDFWYTLWLGNMQRWFREYRDILQVRKE